MTASLYQSGSSVKGCAEAVAAGAARTALRGRRTRMSMSGRAAHAPDRERQLALEAPVLQLAVPLEALAAHELLDLERAVVGQAEFPQRRLEPRFLRPVRVEADRDQHEVVAGALAVIKDLIVEGVVEAHVQVRVQRRV